MVRCDHIIEHSSLVHNTIPRPLFHNNELTPHEVTLDAPEDISIICVYG